MIDILLVVHLVIALLLIVVILLQKNSGDALAGLSGGGNNMGVVSARAAATFFSRITIFLAIAFMVNALLLANLSIKSTAPTGLENKLQEQTEKKSENSIPMAK